MITKAECEREAYRLRTQAYNIVDERNRLQNLLEPGSDPYPHWAREMDRQAGDFFAEASRLIRLAQAPFWKRWLA